jgi:putative integral membrane protein (TIGR02587 family)
MAARMSTNRRFFKGLARAFGGAFLFNLPLWMTMEMWWLGFYMDRWRLVLLILLTIPLLVGLSYIAGFEETFSLKEDLVDAFVAIAVAVVTSTIMLWLMGRITSDMSVQEIVGKVALETVPASIGALLAQSMLGQNSEPRKRKRIHYYGGLFLMAVGALFVAWNVAPTEEILVIAYSMSSVQGLVIMLVSLLIIHAFMFTMEFRGEPDIPEDTPFMTLLLRETVVGYAIALLLSAYVLWSFGRLDGVAAAPALLTIVVLGLPAALGAASARLIL